MFKNILVATDGSKMGDRAMSLACDMSRAYQARLVIIHVLDLVDKEPDWLRFAGTEIVGPYAANVERSDTTAQMEIAEEANKHKKIAQQAAEGLVHSAKMTARGKGVAKVDTIVEIGKPAECILEAARRERADAIVMGSHGYSDLKGIFVGSVSHQVAHQADCACIAIT